ncbi:DNA integrity scanning protein DisA nucleotide-binding domain protein [Hymenobacter psychrotolerans]|uniref:DisA checkpoint controller nucleotide-binding n=1 Tax=Hymenobacter psychrotolerans DSM 18569 TaxID=1121959 RepID=A0A1M6UHK6_9BACT|nr:DNA integrity scanning protein DisA nucleotide-binding domain protein [Hymenobacter psychrotolerans]SHK68702.1 DisA checkpoint controller nucleotide-binding [Hymenobacter psychrotolerans DSM 18569]
MWDHQSLFRVSAQLFADGIFNLLDRTLKPEVFLLGLASARETDEPQAVVVEPTTLRYTSADFAGVKALAASLEPDGPRDVVYHLHPTDHDRYEKLRWYELLRRATEQTLAALTAARGEERLSFCSTPVSLYGYQVVVILQLSAESYQSYYALPVPGPGNRPVSLVHAAVQEFLQDCSRALRESDTDDDRPVLDRDYNEVLRAAGRSFMLRAAAGTHGLYDACNGIAALRHEGDEGVGTMLVARRHHPAIVPVLTLESPIPLRDHRRIRKLLELSEDYTALVSDATDVFGLGYLVPPEDPTHEPMFTVHFTRHYSWELTHDEQVMMKVVSNTPRLPQGRVDAENFARAVQRIFPRLDTGTVEYLWELTQRASEQTHGTILVISEGAAQEAVRLTRQCFRVAPRLMTPSVLRLVTNIDGAVLIEPDGTCHAIGAILDGLATEKGDSSRGSRYNSALRYVESSRYACLAIVVSEDGLIDLLPPLRR